MSYLGLIEHWEKAPIYKLTEKQISVRLPIHIYDSIEAISSKYDITLTQVISDLLLEALSSLDEARTESNHAPK